MADKIDIDARKNFKKSRTNQPENRQILKTASLNSTFTAVLKKEECTSTCSLFKKFVT